MSYPKQNYVAKLVTVAILAMPGLFGPAAVAAVRGSEQLAGVDVVAGSIRFQPKISYGQVRVTVTGPEHFEVVRSFAADESPEIALPGTDGLYKYELRFAPEVGKWDREPLAAARRAGDGGAATGVALSDRQTVQNGSFRVIDGGVVAGDLAEQHAAARAGDGSSSVSGPPQGLVLSTSNGVIRNSLCVGFDCPNSPAFSDSTILLMENNTRIKFGDTSNSPFPTNDWEIEANGQGSGGVSYLAFNDCGTNDNDGGCATDLVFGVEAGARARALWVESDGDVGIGTGNPVVDLHVVTGDTPTLRLDQDGSSGFTPQTWDVAGNETNFFIRDVTNGSRLPLRIRPDAPTNSIYVDVTGEVGIGTASPDANLSVVETTSGVNNVFLTTNNGSQTWKSEDSSNGKAFFMNWVSSGGFLNDDLNFTMTGFTDDNGGADNNFRFSFNDGNLTIGGDFITNTSTYPDYVFADDYALMPLAELASFVARERHLPDVPSQADVDAAGGRFSLNDLQLALLAKVEELTLYTIDQQRTIDSLRSSQGTLQESLTTLRARLEALEEQPE